METNKLLKKYQLNTENNPKFNFINMTISELINIKETNLSKSTLTEKKLIAQSKYKKELDILLLICDILNITSDNLITKVTTNDNYNKYLEQEFINLTKDNNFWHILEKELNTLIYLKEKQDINKCLKNIYLLLQKATKLTSVYGYKENKEYSDIIEKLYNMETTSRKRTKKY